MSSLSISAVIITLNEEKNIKSCLESVSFCEEILIIDSGSNDNTASIAKDCGAKVIHQEWLGYGPQKQFAIEQASHKWVLCLDADERVSPQLKESICHLELGHHNIAGYIMPRRNHFLGKALHYGEGYPDLSLRLFNRQFGSWSLDSVHETVLLNGNTEKLRGDLLHYSEDTIASYLNKQNQYTSLQAQRLFKANKRISSTKCITSPIIRFIKFYFIRRGFLDGLPGLIHITIGCFTAFLKYTKLLELQRSGKD